MGNRGWSWISVARVQRSRAQIAWIACTTLASASHASGDSLPNPYLNDVIAASGLGSSLVKGQALTRGLDSLARLKRAQEEVARDAHVASLLDNSANSVVVSKRVESDGLETTQFQHYYRGLEVYGSQSMHHLGASGSLVQNQLAKFDVNTEPKLSAETAISIAQSVIGNRKIKSSPELKIFPLPEQDAARLVYWLRFLPEQDASGREVLVDAHSGEVLANLSTRMELIAVHVLSTRFAADSRTPGPCQKLNSGGEPVQVNLRACGQAVVNGTLRPGISDPSVVRAMNNSHRVLGYFASVHRRSSYDGLGSALINLVHVGQRYANAFWDSDNGYMAYGDGDGVELGDFTQALDVSAHEVAHGVTSKTANLIGMGESGALNEANSDFFGKLVSGDTDWSIGKAIFIRPRQGRDAIRDLSNPSRLRSSVVLADGNTQSLPYPFHINRQAPRLRSCDDSNDACNVHYNATIPGHAMYLMHQAVGRDVSQKIQYAVLTHAMGPTTGFKQYGAAVRSVCQQLYDARTCQAVSAAFARVGL